MPAAFAFELDAVSVWRWDERTQARRQIIEPLDWRAGSGERWALLGPNGAGKTTLLTILGAVEFPSTGTVVVLGERLGRTDVFRLRERVGFVDARLGRRFAPGLTVEQVASTGATGTVGFFQDRISPADRDLGKALLETLGVDRLAAQRFADCSHGERTRALIARALLARPELLLLDEPGSGLDFAGRETLVAALSRLAREQPELTIVMTTHHLEELPAETTHALLLREGEVVAAGPIAECLTAETLSACFGLPVALSRAQGRWHAVATG